MLQNGRANIDSMKFVADPGSAKVPFIASSNGIDYPRLLTVYKKACLLEEVSLSLPVTFRECIRGEEMLKNLCVICPVGSYSIIPGSCHACPNEA